MCAFCTGKQWTRKSNSSNNKSSFRYLELICVAIIVVIENLNIFRRQQAELQTMHEAALWRRSQGQFHIVRLHKKLTKTTSDMNLTLIRETIGKRMEKLNSVCCVKDTCSTSPASKT